VAAALRRIRMVSVVTVTAFYEPHPQDLRGFGILFPRSSGIEALGAVFNTEVFHGRGEHRSETWIFGGLDRSALPRRDEDAVAQVARDRQVLTGRHQAPIAAYTTCQMSALPVYDASVLDAARAAEALPPDLAIAGNFLGRLGVASLLDGAAEAAERIAAGLAARGNSRRHAARPERPISTRMEASV
jgi:protoporphyrinogen oxidase